MKKKRRVLKNRGYAYSCRQRRIENQLGLECENNQLKTHVSWRVWGGEKQPLSRWSAWEPNRHLRAAILRVLFFTDGPSCQLSKLLSYTLKIEMEQTIEMKTYQTLMTSWSKTARYATIMFSCTYIWVKLCSSMDWIFVLEVRHLELLLSDLQARLAYYEHSAALSSNNTLLLPTSNLVRL